MHDLLIALAYLGILVLPVIAATRQAHAWQAHDLEDKHTKR